MKYFQKKEVLLDVDAEVLVPIQESGLYFLKGRASLSGIVPVEVTNGNVTEQIGAQVLAQFKHKRMMLKLEGKMSQEEFSGLELAKLLANSLRSQIQELGKEKLAEWTQNTFENLKKNLGKIKSKDE